MFRWITRDHLLPAAVVVSVAIVAPLLCHSSAALPRLRQLEAEKRRAQRQISQISQEIWELRARADRVRSNPLAVEQVARDELGLVRQTEIVFQFKE